MSQNIGTLIAASIRPNDSLDPIASAFANEIRGGLHTCSNLSERNAIIIQRREWGMLTYVTNENIMYQLQYGYYNTDITNNLNWTVFTGGTQNSNEWIDSIISFRTNEPTTPTTPDRYILGTSSSASITGLHWDSFTATSIVQWNTSTNSWKINTPTNGTTVRTDNNKNLIYRFDGDFPSGEWKSEKINQVFSITTNGSTNSYTAITSTTFSVYDKDIIFLTKFNIDNSGTSSININGIGIKNIKVSSPTGLRDLVAGDIVTSALYSLTYDGTYFQMIKPFSTDAQNIKYHILTNETVTVKEFEQYWVYGDFTLDGSLINYGNIVIANGAFVNNSNDFENYGTLTLVDIKTPFFNDTVTIGFTSSVNTYGSSFSTFVKQHSLLPEHLNINANNDPITGNVLSVDNDGYFNWIDQSGGGISTSASATESGIVNNISMQELGGVDKLINTVRIGKGGGDIENNLAIGRGTLNENTTGQYNTAIGQGDGNSEGSLFANTTGSENTAIGSDSMVFNTTGSWNTGAGCATLYRNTTGASNVAVGSYALNNNTTGSWNVAIGYLSQSKNTIGARNTAVGDESMVNNTTGNDNTAIGAYSLESCTTGSLNTAVGCVTLPLLTTGASNVAIGSGAGYHITTAIRNTIMGVASMQTTTTGSSNVALGFQAGGNITTGNENIIIGQQTAVGHGLQSGNNNIILNRNLNTGITTGSGNTILGYILGLASDLTNTIIIADGVGNQAIMKLDDNTLLAPTQTNALIDGDTTGKAIITKEFFNNSNSYSTDEIKTGGTWIDGKSIYRKVFTNVDTNVSISITHSLSLGELITARVKLYSDDLSVNANFDIVNTPAYFGDSGLVTNYVDGDIINFENTNSRNLSNISFTLEYTKGTDYMSL